MVACPMGHRTPRRITQRCENSANEEAVMGRAILEPSVRLLNHNELIYAPGDRGLARDLFRALWLPGP